MNLNALHAPFPAADISWRVGAKSATAPAAKAQPYVTRNVALARLDAVVGIGRWRNSYSEVVVGNQCVAVRCSLGVYVENTWIDKEDIATVSVATTTGTPRALDEAYADAFRRAAALWGVGRYLAAYRSPLFELDNDGRFVQTPTLPSELLPAGAAPCGAPVSGSVDAPHEVAPTRASGPPPAAQAAPATAAVKPQAPAPAPAPVATVDTAPVPFDDAALEALPERERQYVKSIVAHLAKRTSLTNLRAYVNGPKMQVSLSEGTRGRLTALIDAAVGQQEMATAT